MSRREPSEAKLPAASDPKEVNRQEVTLSERAVTVLNLSGDQAVLVEKGEVESVVEVSGERIIVGNSEVL